MPKVLEPDRRQESPDIIAYGGQRNHWASWLFNDALGQMRGVFGIHIAIIATRFGLDVEGELASILPGDEGNGDSATEADI
ncbi:MAG: hypothetical protein L6Q98_04670 [Anaerolineae bacterium]|nr:hypothetical protein [Anaerolineae bacterium]NUQ03496.1 hypothetical protein [Anaerolineae bacterium]